MRALKTMLTVIGAVTVLVLAANTVAYAATGGKFILGQTNKANKATTLKRTTNGPALSLVTKPGNTAPFTVTSNGKVTNLNADSLDGLDSSSFVQNGNRGVARAYAHILPGGTLDATRSWNVAASNVVTTSAGFYCFRNLSFTPTNGSVTIDYNGTSNGQVPTVMLKLPANPSHCGLSSAQAEVFTGAVTPGSFTAGTDVGYYVVFY